MAANIDVLSSTLQHYSKKETDQLYKRLPFLDLAKDYKGIEVLPGGSSIVRPIVVGEHSVVTELATGYEPIDLTVGSFMNRAQYEWCDLVMPIVLSKKDQMENSGPDAIVGLMNAKLQAVMSAMRRTINRRIISGVGPTSLHTLNGEFEATGFLEAGVAAAATQTNTVGALQKSVLDVEGWYNSFLEGAAADIVADLTELYQEANQFTPAGQVQGILMNPATFRAYKAALYPNERYVDSAALDGGNLKLAFAGATVMQENEMPANGGASTRFSAMLLNFSGIKLALHKDGNFQASEFMVDAATAALTAHIHFKGQLIADHLRGSGILSGI
jgi:hypothetical protein